MNKDLRINITRDKTPIFRKASLSLISTTHTLRCDAKIAEERFSRLEQLLASVDCFSIGDYLPLPFVKGKQPRYLESFDSSGTPVINTLAIQNLSINLESCRIIAEDDFQKLSEDRKLKTKDVLLTLDGGTSIGKPVLFDFEGDFTVDTHVAILRPEGLPPLALVYLLASPLGQLQFQLAESGASGQTSVTEEDVRRFQFPKIEIDHLTKLVNKLDDELAAIEKEREVLQEKEYEAWERFYNPMLH